MMLKKANEQVECFNDNTNNILSALSFLVDEAKREGNYKLHKIIKAAYELGQRTLTSADDSDIEGKYDQDTLKAAHVLIYFLSASKKVQKEAISIIEQCEQETSAEEGYKH